MLDSRREVTSSAFRSALLLGAIFSLALAARLAWSLWTAPEPPLLSDPEYYNAAALSLARGEGYSVVFDGEQGFLPGGEPTAFWPPGYSAYLAAFYRMFGEGLGVARMANVIAGALTVVPVFFIGRRLFSEAAGSLGAIIAAVLPSFVFWTPVLLSETFFALLFASATALLLYGVDSSRSFRPHVIVAAAVFIAVGTLVRGQAVILLPLAAAWWAMESGRLRAAAGWAALACVIVLAVIAPWAARNAQTMDSPVLLSANYGYNLRVGHGPYSTGRYLAPQDLWDAEPGLTFWERETLFNNLGTRRAIDYAAGHPLREIELAGRKIMWLWRPDSDVLDWVSSYGSTPLPNGAWEPLRLVIDASYLSVLALAGAAALLASKHRSGLLFAALTIAAWTALHVVFFGEPRYHLPILTILASMAGASVVNVASTAPHVLELIPLSKTDFKLIEREETSVP